MKGRKKKMELSELYQLIGSVGFPIVAYLLMFNQNNKVLEDLKKTIEDNNELIKILMERNDIHENK